MIRRAYFGSNSLILLGFHLLFIVLDLTGIIPYVRTMFFPMVNVMGLMLAILGWRERDKFKTPGLVATIVWSASIIFWVVALVLRIQSAG